MSWQDTKIITPAQVRSIDSLADGVEDRKLNSSILEAQHALEQILGTTLYAQVEAAYPTYTGDYQTLYEQHARPFLAWKTLEEALPLLSAEADRNGVFEKSGQDYKSVGGSKLATLIRTAGSRAENRQADMLRYLRNLDSSSAVKIAFDECVDDEPRTNKTYRGRVITRRSKWQRQQSGESYNGVHDEC